MVMAWAALKAGNLARGRACLLWTTVLATAFLVVKFLEYRAHIVIGDVPSRDNFFATYYTLTGLHGLHVFGGIVMMTTLSLPALAPSLNAWATTSTLRPVTGTPLTENRPSLLTATMISLG